MASTNKTTHYNLSQYVGTDKPTYLVDYNADMSNIDTGIYNAKTEAETNTTAIGTLSNLTTTAQTDLVSAINEVDGNVDTLSGTVGDHTTAIATNTGNIGNLTNLDTTNKSNLVSAINEVYQTLSDYNTYQYDVIGLTGANITNGDGTFNSSPSNLTIAYNNNKTMGKVYCSVWYRPSSQSAVTVEANTALTPSTEITIANAGWCVYYDNSGDWKQYYPIGITISTTGKVTFSTNTKVGSQNMLILNPYMYVLNDFGDRV